MILIDRETELEQLKKNVHGVLLADFGANGYGTILVPFEEVEKVIADQPTIEIVRCRECKRWSPAYGGYCVMWNQYIEQDFYCADGERRSENE